MPSPIRLAALLSATLAVAAPAAQAASYVITFTGVITDSVDLGPPGSTGVIFGNGSSGGQTGQAISGSFVIDTAAYPDSDANAFVGAYGPPGVPFPQTANNFLSQYTIAGQTFFPSMHMGQIPGHSTEEASVYPPYGVNFIQQDVFNLRDSSQFLLCGDPQIAATCTGGMQRMEVLSIQLAALLDFLPNDSLEQTFNFDETALDAIRTAGGIAGGFYQHYRNTTGAPQEYFDARGEFRLTSITMGLQTTTEEPDGNAIPEPSSLALLASGALAGLLARRRKRG
jgi:hypothetical protein